jgi:hypothetical protein
MQKILAMDARRGWWEAIASFADEEIAAEL